MARKGIGAGLAVASLFLLEGCGTLLNTCWFTPTEEVNRVYGGVRVDVQLAQEAAVAARDGKDFSERFRAMTGSALMIADVPLSAIGDTLTLPITIPASINREPEHRQAIRSSDTPSPGLHPNESP